MISTLLSLIFKLIFFLVKLVFRLILFLFPKLDLTPALPAISLFWGFCSKAISLLYFIFGPLVYVFLDIVIALWFAKHIILPVVNFTRKAIMDLF